MMSESTKDSQEKDTPKSSQSRDERVEVEVSEASSEDVEVGERASENEGGEVEELKQELEALNDRHLRLAAEFDNFRKRSQNELGATGARAQAALVGQLLDVLDDFGRVSSLDPEQATVESVLEGVQLVEQKLHRVLESAGLEEVETEGATFDPNSMEAMMREPTDREEEDERVAQVLQKGFRFKGHLVRPARVSVRKHE